MSENNACGPLSGRRIALPETREAARLALMLQQHGAQTLSCPMVAIVDLADPAPALAWLRRFIERPFDDLVLLTGEGLRRLGGIARRAGIEAAWRGALRQPRRITRGPKPAQALRALGLAPDLRAEEPTTSGITGLGCSFTRGLRPFWSTICAVPGRVRIRSCLTPMRHRPRTSRSPP